LQTIRVHLGQRGYPIKVGSGVIASVGQELSGLSGTSVVAVITVEGIRRLYGTAVEGSIASSGIRPVVIEVPDREGAKTIQTYAEVMGELLAARAGKDALIVSLGGGCVGDLAGFVAATYMRGVRLVHLPTTLLAQVDSSIGGKAALNLPGGKNSIGAFWQPCLVLSDVDVLKTLPQREVRCGLAELIKYGAIMDIRLFEFIEREKGRLNALEREATLRAISAAARLKAKLVSVDEREAKGLRTLLNFGHTVGHAIEAAMEYRGYSHGEAISVGMVAETRLARLLGLCSDDEAERLERIIESYGLPKRLEGVSKEAIVDLMWHDKKVEGGRLKFALPNGLGRGIVVADPPTGTVAKALEGVVGD